MIYEPIARSDLTNTPLEAPSHTVYEQLAEYMVQTLKLVRETISSFLDTMKAADRAKSEKVIEQVNDFLEQLEKSKKAGFLKGFFDALGAFGVALAMISAVLVPSPATIALAVMTTALFLEPIISKAAGQDSLIAQGMDAIMAPLSEHMGPIAAAIITMLIVVAVLAVTSKGLTSGLQGLSNSSNGRIQAMRQFASDLPAHISRFLGTSVNAPSSQAFRIFLERFESLIMLAQVGVQIPMATLQYQASVLMAEYKLDDVLIANMQSVIEMIGSDFSAQNDYLKTFESFSPQLAGGL